jgi:TPP-dependent 2-oxoacid decarboxylase
MPALKDEEIPVGLYLLRRIRELGCKTVQGLPGTTVSKLELT